jgi:adenylate cyclase
MTADQSSSPPPDLTPQVLREPANDGVPPADRRALIQQQDSGGLAVVTAPEPRRLAAFINADMVGFCRLIGQDDSGTYARMTRLRRMLIDPSLERHGGKMVNAVGDSLFMEFSSVISAVRFAVEVQTRIPEFDGDNPPDSRIRFRMGVNAGDAVPDGPHIYGDSVNIAARLQSVCPTGGICVSAVVRDHVPERLGLQFERLGMLNLKNIARPVEAYVVRLDGPARTRPFSIRGVRVAIPTVCLGLAVTFGMSVLPHYRPTPMAPRGASILVLPFRNVSDEAEQQYLADAVSSDVATDLSRMRDVVVISPATAFTYKGKSVDPKQINRDINVRYLIVGSIRRIAAQVNTNVQLIDAASGVQLWGERFDHEFVDLAKLEEAITGRIAASLDVQLVQAEGRRAERAVVPDALDLRLRATSLFYQSVIPENTMAARQLLTRAVQLDPRSAEAWARLAQLTASDYFNHWNDTGREQLRDAEEAVRQALLIDPNLALAHFANGFIHRTKGEHHLALEAFVRAIDLNPSFALAYAQKADELILTGRPNEAQPLVEQAIRLSPRDPSLGIFYWFIGRAEFCAGRYDEAIPWLRKSVEVRQNIWYNRLYLASAYALRQDLDAARQTLADFNQRFASPAYTVAVVIAHEGTNPDNDPTVVAARANFHRGLLMAGMAEN